MRIVCWQTILMKYHTLFFRKLGKMSQNLSSAAVVIGALRVKKKYFRNTIRVSNSLDPDQARCFGWPDLFPNCLQRLSALDTSTE